MNRASRFLCHSELYTCRESRQPDSSPDRPASGIGSLPPDKVPAVRCRPGWRPLWSRGARLGDARDRCDVTTSGDVGVRPRGTVWHRDATLRSL